MQYLSIYLLYGGWNKMLQLVDKKKNNLQKYSFKYVLDVMGNYTAYTVHTNRMQRDGLLI